MRASAIILSLTLAAALLHADGKKAKDDPNQIGDRNVGKCLNAFALPGGHIFIYTGLIRIADEEDELAGAIAHEIAHIAARHLTCRATKGEVANIAATLGGIMGGGGWTGYAIRQVAGLGVPMTFLSFSRHDESEADYLGVQYMYAAGYDPNGAVSIFEKMEALERQRPGVISRAFATHPMDADRIAKTEKEIDTILPARPQYVVSTSDYKAMRDRLIARQNQRKINQQEDQPKLRVAPGSGQPETSDPDADSRPTIRR